MSNSGSNICYLCCPKKEFRGNPTGIVELAVNGFVANVGIGIVPLFCLSSLVKIDPVPVACGTTPRSLGLNSLMTISGRIKRRKRKFHCDACGKRQTTSWRCVNNAASQVHCEVWFTLGKQEIPARPNSVDVRVGDKLKVVQFHPVIRNNSTPSPNMMNFGWHQLGVLWIRNTSLSDVRCPVKDTNGWRQSRCSLGSQHNSESCKIPWCSANFNSVTLLNREKLKHQRTSHR